MNAHNLEIVWNFAQPPTLDLWRCKQPNYFMVALQVLKVQKKLCKYTTHLQILKLWDLKQCPSITPIGDKFLSLFENLILKSRKAFVSV